MSFRPPAYDIIKDQDTRLYRVAYFNCQRWKPFAPPTGWNGPGDLSQVAEHLVHDYAHNLLSIGKVGIYSDPSVFRRLDRGLVSLPGLDLPVAENRIFTLDDLKIVRADAAPSPVQGALSSQEIVSLERNISEALGACVRAQSKQLLAR